MKITKMALNKSALAAMFLMMTSAYSINVQAGVCEAELNNWNHEYLREFPNEQAQRNVAERQLNHNKTLESGEYFPAGSDLSGYIEYFTSSRNLLVKPDQRAANDYDLCMTIAQRDGLLKSTKQANNKSKASTGTQTSKSANANSQDATNQDATNNDTSSNTKPLTKAQLKAQKAEQAAQAAEQDVQQDTQLAQENQAKANKARQGKRRRHEPENEAHKCISPDFGGLYGGMENTCNFKVAYTYCGYRPTENSWLRGMSCEKQSFGAGFVSPGRQDAAHTHGVEKLYWFACKDPAWPVDVEFVDGDIKGRCHTVGGGSD